MKEVADFEVFGEQILAFEQNYQRRWEIRISPSGESKPRAFMISYTDLNGERQVQEFRLQIVVPGDGSVDVYVLEGPTQIFPWDQEQIDALVATLHPSREARPSSSL